MTLDEFKGTRRHVSDVTRHLVPLGFDFGDDPGTPAYVYDDGSIVIYGKPGLDACMTLWCHEQFNGTLSDCEDWLYGRLAHEGLV